MAYTDILKTIPVTYSANLAAMNLVALKKKKKKAGDLIGYGVGNIVGVSLAKEVADFVG